MAGFEEAASRALLLSPGKEPGPRLVRGRFSDFTDTSPYQVNAQYNRIKQQRVSEIIGNITQRAPQVGKEFGKHGAPRFRN